MRRIKFADGFNIGFKELFFLFLVGCVFGSAWETFAYIILHHVLVNRSALVWGPFNMVYGLGAVLITVALRPVAREKGTLIFLYGAIVGGAFEYVCSLVQELVFGTVSWEYSDIALNIGGRTNALYMLFWGLLAYIWIKWLLPWLLKQFWRIPANIVRPVTLVLAVFMLFNMLVSAAAVRRMTDRHNGIAACNRLEERLDERFDDERMQRIYPNMRYVD